MQLARIEEALSHAAATQRDKQDRPRGSQQLADASGKHQGNRIYPGEIGLCRAQRLQPGREGLDPRQRGEQDFLIAPAGRRAPQRHRGRQGSVVVVLCQPALQQGLAVSPLHIGQALQLKAFLDGVRQQVKNAALVFLQVGGERLQPGRFGTELAFGTDTTGMPVMRREQVAIEQEDAFVGHQVFILVMMS